MARSSRSRNFTVRLSGSATTIVPSAAAPPVPEGPEELATADFVNGVYRIGGSAVAIEDLFTENSDFGPFNPEFGIGISSEGLIGSPVTTPDVTAILLADEGFTAVGEFHSGGGNSGRLFLVMMDLPDWNASCEARLAFYNSGTNQPTEAIAANNSRASQAAQAGDGPWRFAVTVVFDHVSISIDGSPILTKTLPWVPDPPFNNVGIAMNGAPLKNVTFHPPQPDAALPGLSA